MARLREDRLRVLRGLRFAAGLGFTWDPPSWAAAVATDIHGLSSERVLQEIDKGLACGAPGAWLRQVAASGHLMAVLPPVDAAQIPRLAEALDRLPRDAAADLRLAVVLTDGADPASWWQRQPLSRERQRRLAWLHTGRRSWPQASTVQRRRLARHVDAPLLASLLQAVDGDPTVGAALRAECMAGPFSPLLSPADLIVLGIPPGPALGRLLLEIEDGQLAGTLTTRAQAEAFARSRMPSAR
jgi:hypothetical protein